MLPSPLNTTHQDVWIVACRHFLSLRILSHTASPALSVRSPLVASPHSMLTAPSRSSSFPRLLLHVHARHCRTLPYSVADIRVVLLALPSNSPEASYVFVSRSQHCCQLPSFQLSIIGSRKLTGCSSPYITTIVLQHHVTSCRCCAFTCPSRRHSAFLSVSRRVLMHSWISQLFFPRSGDGAD